MDRRKNKKKNQPHKGKEPICRPQELNPRPLELNPRPQEPDPHHQQLSQPTQEEEVWPQSFIEHESRTHRIHLEIHQEQGTQQYPPWQQSHSSRDGCRT